MVFKKDLIKFWTKKKYKIHTTRKDIKNLKYVKTIKKYKILTRINLNYKFKKIVFKKKIMTHTMSHGTQFILMPLTTCERGNHALHAHSTDRE